MAPTVPRNPVLLVFACLAGLAVIPGEAASAKVPRPKIDGSNPTATSRPHGGSAIVFPDIEPPDVLEDNRRKGLLRKSAPLLLKVLGDLPQVLEMRLTPVRSVLENGAKIEFASGIDFTGPTLKSPTGAYWLSGKATDWSAITPTAPSRIEIRVPTEIGKVYAVDCRAREYDALQNKFTEASFNLSLNGVAQAATTDGGHVLGATKATATTSTITIEYRDALARPFHALAFWGCDVGKTM